MNDFRTKYLWPLTSRIQRLNGFPKQYGDCYVKRDDELGCGISGSKLRKYASLMPQLITAGVQHLLLIAGSQSNNLLAALQMAREFQLEVTVFLLRPRSMAIQGNFKLSSLFINEKEIIWISRDEWPQVESMAHTCLQSLNVPGFVLTEGASVPEALEGAMTLADDLILNERHAMLDFAHIFIDAGTGFTAAATLKRLAELNHPGIIHILLLADDEHVFRDKLMNWIGYNPANYTCFYPKTAKSFGSINQSIKQEIRRLAREEGILADPVYAAKLFHESRRVIELHQLQGTKLIIHSGGTLTMPAFNY